MQPLPNCGLSGAGADLQKQAFAFYPFKSYILYTQLLELLGSSVRLLIHFLPHLTSTHTHLVCGCTH